MTHIFLSYQHQYKETVVALRDALQSNGFKTWFDLDDMGKISLLLVYCVVNRSLCPKKDT